MEIKPGLQSLSLQVAPASLPALARAITIGQLLEALVVRADPVRGTVLLQLPEGEVEARSEIPLQPGTRLHLTPEADGHRILLRVQPDPLQQTRLAAMRQALPREAPLAPVFELLETLLQSPPPALPEPVRREARLLSEARPTPERLATGNGLRTALGDAGLSLESHLSDPAAPPPAADLKARLLALLATLSEAASAPSTLPKAPTASPAAPSPTATPTPAAPPEPPADHGAVHGRSGSPSPAEPQKAPPQESAPAAILTALARHVEGALARIQLHQLQALPDAQPAPQWLFELPIRTPQGNDTLLLRFEREPREGNGAAAAPGWNVTLDLSHPEHGALRAVVAWRGGEISTRFFAERAATAERLRQHMQVLNQRLAAAGIPVGALEAHTGIPPAPRRGAPAPILSERA